MNITANVFNASFFLNKINNPIATNKKKGKDLGAAKNAKTQHNCR